LHLVGHFLLLLSAINKLALVTRCGLQGQQVVRALLLRRGASEGKAACTGTVLRLFFAPTRFFVSLGKHGEDFINS
jgi:hypothetical protein